PALMHERIDFFDNYVHYFTVQAPHKILTITAISDLDIHYLSPQSQMTSPPWEQVRDSLTTDTTAAGLSARAFILASPFITPNAVLADYAQSSFTPQRPLLEAVLELTQRIYSEFTYDAQFSTIATPLAEVLEHRRGVCQDFAHLAIACLRTQGLAARYVSGYLETLPPPGQAKLRGVDASHAWFSVYIPQQGWIDFDPTNNQMITEQYITTAWGRDYNDVTPLKGIIFGGGSEHRLEVAVDVERLAS
ncbi:MAG: transglutaminase family protein, partial [Pseudomonadota bacterium]|nr:transglutaminase family protein [Pseudomonadota bacterium]